MKKLILLLFAGLAVSVGLANQAEDEAAIRQVVQGMQDGWNRKDGTAFAAGFAAQHDYININGLYLPNARREGNARAHQQLFDSVYKETDLQLRVAKIKFLSPEIALVHLQGHTHPAGKPAENRQEVVISGVLQRHEGRWEIAAFQNTPVQARPEPKPAQ